MATCFSDQREAGDGVLRTKELISPAAVGVANVPRTRELIPPMAIKLANHLRTRGFIVIESPFITAEIMMTKRPIPVVAPTGSDGVEIICSSQEFTEDGVQELVWKGAFTSSSSSNLQRHYMFGNPMIYETVGIRRSCDYLPEFLRRKAKYLDMSGKTSLYSDIITGHNTSSKFTGNHEILLSSFEYGGNSVVTAAEMARLIEWGEPSYLRTASDPMVGPQGYFNLFAEPGVSSRIQATPEHRIDIPAAATQGRNIISDAGGGRRAALMACVGEQAVAGVVANQIAAAGSNALALYFMVLAIMFGLTFKLAAVALQGNTRCRNLSIWVGKIGDMLTASAIIVSLAVHLPPLTACIAAPLAFGIIALSVAFA